MTDWAAFGALVAQCRAEGWLVVCGDSVRKTAPYWATVSRCHDGPHEMGAPCDEYGAWSGQDLLEALQGARARAQPDAPPDAASDAASDA